MNILCATDDNYTPYCGIMLTSLLENNRDVETAIYILTDGISSENEAILRSLEDKYSCKIFILKVNADDFKDCPIDPETDHVSLAAYYRLALTSLLPASLHKILYLDCDMIINGPLSALYNTEIDNVACGVVKDEASMWNIHYNRLGVAKDTTHPYFNSGVLLINLDYWRKHNIQHQCMECITANKSRLAFHDQDTLNLVLAGKVKYLPVKYNLQRELLLQEVFNEVSSSEQEEILQACKNADIIHYTGSSKPWVKGCKHPLAFLWLKYKSLSLWRKKPLLKNKKNLKELFFEIRNKIIWSLGLKRKPYSYII